jgi:hypothetical protein
MNSLVICMLPEATQISLSIIGPGTTSVSGILSMGNCYEHQLHRLLAVRPWRTQGCLLYLVALLHLPSFFRFDVLV